MDRSVEPKEREGSATSAPRCGDRALSFLDEWVPRSEARRRYGRLPAPRSFVAQTGWMTRAQRRALKRHEHRMVHVHRLLACMCGVCISVSGLLLGQSATFAMMSAPAPSQNDTFTADGHGVLINVLTTSVEYTVVPQATYSENIPFTRPTPNSLVVGAYSPDLPSWVGVATTNVTDTGGDVNLMIDAPPSASGKTFTGTVTVYVGPGHFDFYTIDVTIQVKDPPAKLTEKCDDNGQGDDKSGDTEKDHGQGSCHTADPHDNTLGQNLSQTFGDSLKTINDSSNLGNDANPGTHHKTHHGDDKSSHERGHKTGDDHGTLHHHRGQNTVGGNVYGKHQTDLTVGGDVYKKHHTGLGGGNDSDGAIPTTLGTGSGSDHDGHHGSGGDGK